MSDSARSRPSSNGTFPSLWGSPSPPRSVYAVLLSTVTGYPRRNGAPAACKSSSSNSASGDGRDGGTEERGCPFFREDLTGQRGRSSSAAATDPEAVADPSAVPVDSQRASLAATKPFEQMTPREVMRLLPTEDQEHVMRVARQGRLFGVVSAAAAGTWVYKALRRRGSPFPLAGGALIGLALGYPLGITMTMAFHGRFLRRISQDLMETQRRARERASRDAPPSAEYYSTFPAAGPESERQGGRRSWGDDPAAEAAAQQQRPPWGSTTEFLDDTRAAGAAAAPSPQQSGAGAAPGSGKASRIDGTGKGDEILKA